MPYAIPSLFLATVNGTIDQMSVPKNAKHKPRNAMIKVGLKNVNVIKANERMVPTIAFLDKMWKVCEFV